MIREDQLLNRSEIIRMAREAGLLVIGTADGSEAVYTWPQGITDELECFAALIASRVAAAEREACAKQLDEDASHYVSAGTVGHTISKCATAIRARGETSSRGQA